MFIQSIRLALNTFLVLTQTHSHSHQHTVPAILLLLLTLVHEFIYLYTVVLHCFTTYYLFASSVHTLHTAFVPSKSFLIFVLYYLLFFALLLFSRFAVCCIIVVVIIIIVIVVGDGFAPASVVYIAEVDFCSPRFAFHIVPSKAYIFIYFLHFQFRFDSGE